jgi:hypothetical protein
LIVSVTVPATEAGALPEVTKTLAGYLFEAHIEVA